MNVKEKLISIIVPVYNAELYIGECLNSLINQSYCNLQIILVNDGSTDKSGEICDKFAKTDSRIVVVHQNNSGVSAARNAGISVSTGEYVGFVDSDDTLPEYSISTLVNEMQEHDVDAVFGNFNMQFENGLLERKGRLKENNYLCKDLLSYMVDDGTLSGLTLGSVCGALYKTDIIKEKLLRFCENIKINEDGIFNFQYCIASRSIRYIQKPIYNYRQWKSSKNPNINQLIRLFSEATQILQEICKTEETTIEDFDIQLKCRELFCIFQESMAASRLKYKDAVSFYKKIWNTQMISQYSENLNYSAMGKYKRFLWKLISRKSYLIFYVVMHYGYPILKRYIRR